MTDEQRRAFELLSSGTTLEEAAARGELAAHRGRLLALSQELPPDSRFATALQELSAALLLDLAFLRTYPEAILPVLHWRCAFHDNPVLAELAQRWREERTTARPGSVWVHALLPPPHAPGGPLLAELRMARPHELLSPMTSEGHVVLDERGVIRHWAPEEGTLVDGPGVARPAHRLELITRGWDGAALHDAATGMPRHELAIPEEGNATSGSFSPDGTLCVLAGFGEDYNFGFLHLHETATGRLLHKWEGPRPFRKQPVFSPDGRHVLAPSDAGLFLCDTVTGQLECLPIHDAQGVAFSADGRRLVTTNEEVVRVWDLARLRALGPQAPEHSRPMRFSPDGRRLVAGDWLRDGATGQRLRKLDIHRGRYLEGGPTQNWFTCGSVRIVSLEGGIHVWETESGKPLAHRSNVYYPYWYMTAFSADGLRYAAGKKGDSEVKVLDVDTGELLAEVELAKGDIESLALSPEGQVLAIGTQEGPIEIWSVASGQRLVTLSGHGAPVNELAFSLDGRSLVSAGDNEALRLWAIPSGAALASRPLDARDPSYYQSGSGKRWTWHATSEALRAISGWEGFVGPRPVPFSAEVQGGVTLFFHRETKQLAAAFPGVGPWLPHPDGVTWASPSAHVVLEGAAGPSQRE
ncbi:hypothetical protein F0U60_38690 [Archangium minus]|uniref:WD40 repeat domain-containing protein n=1 Tax=Archangium minus TaxID=83450 RepID=A0ABY9X1X0_9BACT|nr:hypothetical protein F0U60_38690 [Archangium minus]